MKETTILITPKLLLEGWPIAKLPELKGEDKDTIINCLSRYGSGRTEESDRVATEIQRGNGRWLICSCKRADRHPPTLFFRSNQLVRHHRSGEHHVDCVFYRAMSEQKAALLTYAKPSPKRLSLLTRLRGTLDGSPATTRREGRWRRRSTLARLLCTLLTEAEIQKSGPSKRLGLERQISEVERIARTFYVDDNVRLSEVLCTDAAEFEAFKTRIASDELPWGANSRRQGVFLFHVHKVEGRSLFPVAETCPINVINRIAVYGEMTSDDDETEEGTVDTRAPYLCIGIVGQQEKKGPVKALSCYLHPSYNAKDLMLVDSILERKTFAQIVSTALSLKDDGAEVVVSIEKPLFDVAPNTVKAEGEEDDNMGTRPVLIPDFIVRVTGKGRMNDTIVIETLGFESTTYRDRKRVLVPMMCEALGNDGKDAAYLDFDFFDGHADEISRHRNFRGRLRNKIAGWIKSKAKER